MTSDITATLRSYFGYYTFRNGQAEAIHTLLKKQHTLVVMPTGSGKSIIYQIAALRLPGTALVISPLIALMKDQVDSLERRNIPVSFINSTISQAEQTYRLHSMAEGRYKIVYVAPERFRNTSFVRAIQHQKISLLAVDEAHCISAWGHDFRPDYLRIGQARAQLGNPLTVALTATATPQVQTDILRLLGLPGSTPRIVTGFNRPNLSFQVLSIAQPHMKLDYLRKLLKDLKSGACIIYTGTRREAEEVAHFTRDDIHIPAEHYHAGLAKDDRERIQEDFMRGRLRVVAATNAFGMGIDRPDVRLVIHYHLPSSLEAYYQEAGRAGRDGSPAQAILLYAPEDRSLQEYFIRSGSINLKELSAVYQALHLLEGEEGWFTNSYLSETTHLNETKIRLATSVLEECGAIKHMREAGTNMLLRCQAWDSAKIEQALLRQEQHQAHRFEQLEKMVAYAQAATCRRNTILTYFGDRDPAQAPLCCDNCLSHNSPARPAPEKKTITPTKKTSKPSQATPTPLERPADIRPIILEFVVQFPGILPRSNVAKLLVGSSSKRVKQYLNNPFYGRLSSCTRFWVLAKIDELLRAGQVSEDRHGCLISAEPNSCQPAKTEYPYDRSPNGCDHQNKQETYVHRIVLLGDDGSASAVPELVAALKHQSGNIRRLAASALGKIGHAAACGPLMEMLLTEGNPQARQDAVKALGQVGDPQARILLTRIAADPSEKEYTRDAARNALTKLKRWKP